MSCTMLASPIGDLHRGLDIQYGSGIATLVPEALASELGLHSPSADDVFKKVMGSGSAGMEDLFELPLPRKVELQSFPETHSSFSSEGAASSPFSTPPALQPYGSNTAIIFDWDDTLLCTSWLSKYASQQTSQELDLHLHKIASRAQSLLESAMRMGHTYIITNSVAGWVEYSAAIWVPQLLPVLQQVHVISARARFEHMFPHDPVQWKLQAFLEVQRQLTWTPIENLVVLGDAAFEMEAACALEGGTALVKTVKFQENPTAKEHLRQLEAVCEKFERIVQKPRSLKVSLERKGAVPQQ